MTKNELAQQINHKANITRTIASNFNLDFTEGQVYDNRGKAESWSDDSGTMDFIPEIGGKIIYTLYCNNVPCHKVDYANAKEVEILGAENCETEGEVLVSAETKMRITYVSTDEDAEEMGYYTIELELI